MTIHKEPPVHYLGYTVAGKVPIILIPGILSKWGYMKKLGDRISLRGHPVYIVQGLGYNLYNIPVSARILRAFIVRMMPKFRHVVREAVRGGEAPGGLVEKEGLKGAIIVAHSKGALIGKYFLAHYNVGHRVLGMIAVSSPFSGSSMARLIPHDSFKELRTGSVIIHDLRRHQKVNGQIVSIYPEYDTHIRTTRGSFLEGAENIKIPVGGHNTLPANQKIMEAVLAAIDKMTLRV